MEPFDPFADPPGTRYRLTPEIKSLVWEKTGGRCWYCGVQTNPFRDFQVDHVIPVSAFGTNDVENLVPSCRKCNHVKANLSLEEFREWQSVELFWFEQQADE